MGIRIVFRSRERKLPLSPTPPPPPPPPPTPTPPSSSSSLAKFPSIVNSRIFGGVILKKWSMEAEAIIATLVSLQLLLITHLQAAWLLVLLRTQHSHCGSGEGDLNCHNLAVMGSEKNKQHEATCQQVLRTSSGLTSL